MPRLARTHGVSVPDRRGRSLARSGPSTADPALSRAASAGPAYQRPWAGAGSRFQRIALDKLAGRTLEPYSGERPETLKIEGDPVELDSRHAFSLSLVLHELATNAVKYGALSVPGGHLRLTWRVTDQAEARQVRLVWEEHGGPPVTPPEREGFGTDMIARVFDYELGGKLEFDFRREGLRMEARFPLS